MEMPSGSQEMFSLEQCTYYSDDCFVDGSAFSPGESPLNMQTAIGMPIRVMWFGDRNRTLFLEHRLEVETGTYLLLLRNIDRKNGLLNGTRLVAMRCRPNLLQARIITGSRTGDIVVVPRITFQSNDVQPYLNRCVVCLPYRVSCLLQPGSCGCNILWKSTGDTMTKWNWKQQTVLIDAHDLCWIALVPLLITVASHSPYFTDVVVVSYAVFLLRYFDDSTIPLRIWKSPKKDPSCFLFSGLQRRPPTIPQPFQSQLCIQRTMRIGLTGCFRLSNLSPIDKSGFPGWSVNALHSFAQLWPI
jgi:hypothetical protein